MSITVQKYTVYCMSLMVVVLLKNKASTINLMFNDFCQMQGMFQHYNLVKMLFS